MKKVIKLFFMSVLALFSSLFILGCSNNTETNNNDNKVSEKLVNTFTSEEGIVIEFVHETFKKNSIFSVKYQQYSILDPTIRGLSSEEEVKLVFEFVFESNDNKTPESQYYNDVKIPLSIIKKHVEDFDEKNLKNYNLYYSNYFNNYYKMSEITFEVAWGYFFFKGPFAKYVLTLNKYDISPNITD